MKKTNKIVISVMLVAILVLGIAYAAIQNITLKIEGTATAEPATNFNVKFTGEPVVSNSEYVTAEITNDTKATVNVSGLKEEGKSVTATYTIKNESTNLSADLSVETTNSNPDYFIIRAELEEGSLTKGEETTLLVTVILTKVPEKDTQTATIGVDLTAMPVEPGQEGKSEGIKDFSQTPVTSLASVTNANIGEYIDLGNNLVGTEETTDDWRILYVEGSTVYAILADYLPAEKIPSAAGLTTNTSEKKYSVWSETDRDTLINGLKHETAWNSLANGITEATVKGAPTGEMLVKSYNKKNGTSLEFNESTTTNLFSLSSSSTTNYDLYVPHTEIHENCSGYWLASPHTSYSISVWNVSYNGDVGYSNYISPNIGVRPVVSLPSSIKATKAGDIWTVDK